MYSGQFTMDITFNFILDNLRNQTFKCVIKGVKQLQFFSEELGKTNYYKHYFKKKPSIHHPVMRRVCV